MPSSQGVFGPRFLAFGHRVSTRQGSRTTGWSTSRWLGCNQMHSIDHLHAQNGESIPPLVDPFLRHQGMFLTKPGTRRQRIGHDHGPWGIVSWVKKEMQGNQHPTLGFPWLRPASLSLLSGFPFTSELISYECWEKERFREEQQHNRTLKLFLGNEANLIPNVFFSYWCRSAVSLKSTKQVASPSKLLKRSKKTSRTGS